jgi:hypothetical protein
MTSNTHHHPGNPHTNRTATIVPSIAKIDASHQSTNQIRHITNPIHHINTVGKVDTNEVDLWLWVEERWGSPSSPTESPETFGRQRGHQMPQPSQPTAQPQYDGYTIRLTIVEGVIKSTACV